MTLKTSTGWFIFLLLFCVLSHGAQASHGTQASPDTQELIKTHLYAGQTAVAEQALLDKLSQDSSDDQVLFALGVVQFVKAVEKLSQSMYQYGLRSSVEVFEMPFFRMPVAYNPNPEKLTYGKTRKILQRFVTYLSIAERTLARIESNDVNLPLNIGLVQLDMNADGKIAEDETLWRIFQRIAPQRRITEEDSRAFVIDLDRSDVPWLRAYCHLLMGLAEFPLAYDWHMAFEHTFHALFPRSGLPCSSLDEQVQGLQARLEQLRKEAQTTGRPLYATMTMSERRQFRSLDFRTIADFIGFVHLNHWPVAEPRRMRKVLAHLEKMIVLSRANWKLILAEEDTGKAEWLPNPNQTGVLPGMMVTQNRVDGWLLFLDEFEALLQGRKLLPHWRLSKGINLRRVFTEPRTFDLILWIQGSAALPYFEDGELTTKETWQTIFNMFQGDFFNYAIWFN